MLKDRGWHAFSVKLQVVNDLVFAGPVVSVATALHWTGKIATGQMAGLWSKKRLLTEETAGSGWICPRATVCDPCPRTPVGRGRAGLDPRSGCLWVSPLPGTAIPGGAGAHPSGHLGPKMPAESVRPRCPGAQRCPAPAAVLMTAGLPLSLRALHVASNQALGKAADPRCPSGSPPLLQRPVPPPGTLCATY